jgi:hypothetical protein
MRRLFFLFLRNDLFALVRPAVRAHVVGLKRFVALGALIKVRRVEFVMGATFISP